MNKLKFILNKILEFDNKIFNKLYRYKDNLFINITAYLGNIFFILFIITLIYFLPIKYGKNISIISFISLLLNTFIIFIIKFTVRRKRVYENNSLLINIETYSFPSGHINRISCLIIPFCYYPFFSLFLLILSIIVSFTRMVKGYHYLSDCIIGFLIGVILGFFVNICSFLYVYNILKILTFIKSFFIHIIYF